MDKQKIRFTTCKLHNICINNSIQVENYQTEYNVECIKPGRNTETTRYSLELTKTTNKQNADQAQKKGELGTSCFLQVKNTGWSVLILSFAHSTNLAVLPHAAIKKKKKQKTQSNGALLYSTCCSSSVPACCTSSLACQLLRSSVPY